MPYRAPAEFSWQSTDQYVHARRVVAAIVLVAVGWSTGFFAGRMSAWLFPVTNSDTAAVESSSLRAAGPAARTTAAPPAPPPAVQTTTTIPSTPPADEKQKTAATPTPLPPAAPAPPPAPAAASPPAAAPASEIVPPERSRPNEDPAAAARRDVAKTDPKSPAPPDVARTTENPAQEEARGPRSGVVLVNPEWTQARPISPQRELGERERGRGGDRESMYDGPGLAECESRYTSFRRSDGTYQPYGRSSRELCPFLR